MTRIYRTLCEFNSANFAKDYKTQSVKKHFGKITVDYGENIRTGKTYFTITSSKDFFDDDNQKIRLKNELVSALKFFFKKLSISPIAKILVVGLGNEKITADSLGPSVTDKLTVTSHAYKNERIRSDYGNLCAIKPSVSGITGIESYPLVCCAVQTAKPDLIVAVDTLSCGKTERLARTIQLTDDGIEPGGGVNNPKKKLTESSLKTPIIAIGVPFVIYVKTILREYGIKDVNGELNALIVTAKEIDFLIKDYSDIISSAINEVVHGKS